MHRQFGKLMGKGAGDKASVSVILNDYEDVDKTLTKVGDLLTLRSMLILHNSSSKPQNLGEIPGSQSSESMYPRPLYSKSSIVPS